MKYKVILAIASLSVLQACAAQPKQVNTEPTVWSELVQQLTRDPRDAPWDPPPGRSLFEQLPPWDNEAEKRCCGHLRSCQPHQSPRC